MRRYYIIGLLLVAGLLSGCDALEAKRLNAEAEAARARASEIRELYDGRAAETEAKTAQIIARQQAAEEERESLLAAETHRVLLRQLELDRRAARRANDLAWLVIIGAPLTLIGAVCGGAVLTAYRRGKQQRRAMLFHQIAHLQRRKQLRSMTHDDVNAVLSGAASLEWYLVAPVTAQLPGGEMS